MCVYIYVFCFCVCDCDVCVCKVEVCLQVLGVVHMCGVHVVHVCRCIHKEDRGGHQGSLSFTLFPCDKASH